MLYILPSIRFSPREMHDRTGNHFMNFVLIIIGRSLICGRLSHVVCYTGIHTYWVCALLTMRTMYGKESRREGLVGWKKFFAKLPIIHWLGDIHFVPPSVPDCWITRKVHMVVSTSFFHFSCLVSLMWPSIKKRGIQALHNRLHHPTILLLHILGKPVKHRWLHPEWL